MLALRVEPGEREAYEEAGSVGHAAPAPAAAAVAPSQRPRYYTPPQPGDQPLAPLPYATARSRCRRSAAAPRLDFPATERARLSNGIQSSTRAATPSR